MEKLKGLHRFRWVPGPATLGRRMVVESASAFGYDLSRRSSEPTGWKSPAEDPLWNKESCFCQRCPRSAGAPNHTENGTMVRSPKGSAPFIFWHDPRRVLHQRAETWYDPRRVLHQQIFLTRSPKESASKNVETWHDPRRVLHQSPFDTIPEGFCIKRCLKHWHDSLNTGTWPPHPAGFGTEPARRKVRGKNGRAFIVTDRPQT